MDETMQLKSKRRHKRIFRHLAELGSEPGTLVVHPDLAQYGTKMIVTAFDEKTIEEKSLESLDEIADLKKRFPIVWLRVYGLGNISALQDIAKMFNLHKLAMEDVVNTHQRPKVEEYGDVTFAIARMPYIVEDELDLEQISIFWGTNFVITFNERDKDCLEPLRDRIRKNVRRNMMLNPEYLSYSVIDTIVDSFFPILEVYGLELDDIEEDAIINPSRKIIVNIHDFKRDLAVIRRAMWSQREAVRNLSDVIKSPTPEMKFFIRDCEDHTIQLIDILESYRERTSGLMDVYLSAVNNKMNEIMKVLTMIATIFMPIGVVASIYGMNFDRSYPANMPELGWSYGYEYALSIMATIAIVMIFFFWRKGWLRRKDFG